MIEDLLEIFLLLFIGFPIIRWGIFVLGIAIIIYLIRLIRQGDLSNFRKVLFIIAIMISGIISYLSLYEILFWDFNAPLPILFP